MMVQVRRPVNFMGISPSMYFLCCEMSSFHNGMEHVMTGDKAFSDCTNGITGRNITEREGRSTSRICLYSSEDKYLPTL